MFGEWISLDWLATEEELLSFLRLWGWLFAIAYVLRLIQLFRRWVRRKKAVRLARKEAKRKARRR